MHAKSLHLCLILCDPMHCSLPGSYIHEIFQARILEWVAIPFFRNEPILIHSYGLKSILFSNFFSFCLFFSVLFFFFLIQDPIQDTMLHLSIMFLGSPGLYQFPQFNSVQFSSVQFSSVTQSYLTLCDPKHRSTPGLPVHHQLPEFTQTHVHWVSDAIQPSYDHSSPSPPAPSPSQHHGLFQSVLHMRWPKYWSFSFSINLSNEHPGLISFRMDWLDLLEFLRLVLF